MDPDNNGLIGRESQVGRRHPEAGGDSLTGNFAIIPVKGLVESKSRLARSLSPEDKKKLILALLEDVLAAVKESKVFSRVLVVSPDPNVEKEANLPHGTSLHQEGKGLSHGNRQSPLFAIREKASSLTVLLTDI